MYLHYIYYFYISWPSWPSEARREQRRSGKPGLNFPLLHQLQSQGSFCNFFLDIIHTMVAESFWSLSLFCKLFRDLTTSPGSSYKPYLKFSVNAILARGEGGEEEVEDKKVVLKSSSREEKDHGGSPSPSLSPQPAPYPSSSPPLSPIVTQVRQITMILPKTKLNNILPKWFFSQKNVMKITFFSQGYFPGSLVHAPLPTKPLPR